MNDNRLAKIAEYIFYIALTIEVVLVVLERSAYIIHFSGIWFRVTILLFAIKILLTKYTIREYIAIGCFAIFGLISYLCSGSNEIFRIVLMIAACKGLNMERVFKLAFFELATGFGICILLSFLGIGIFSVTADFRGTGVTTRYAFGLGHPNTVHGMIWIAMMYFFYAFRDRIRIYHLAVMMIVNLGLFYFTNSRTGLIVISFLLIGTLVAVLSPRFMESKVACILSIIFAVLPIPYAIVIMNRKFYQRFVYLLDAFITGRIRTTFIAGTYCEIASWLPFSAYGREPISDIGIAKMIGWLGYIPALVYTIVVCIMLRHLQKKTDYVGMVILLTLTLSLFIEAHIVTIYICTNVLYLIIGKYWPEIIKSGEENVQETEKRLV